MTKNTSISVINMAARQRMLSQRMILQTVLAANGNKAQLQAAQASFQLFRESQTHLRATEHELDATSARQIRETYDSPGVSVPPLHNSPRAWMPRCSVLPTTAHACSKAWQPWWPTSTPSWRH